MCAHISINVSSVPTNSPSSILSNASGFSWWSSHPMQLSCPNRNYHSLKLCSNIARNSQAHCYTPKVLYALNGHSNWTNPLLWQPSLHDRHCSLECQKWGGGDNVMTTL